MPRSAPAPGPGRGLLRARGHGRRLTRPKPSETLRAGPKGRSRCSQRSPRPTSPAPILLSMLVFAYEGAFAHSTDRVRPVLARARALLQAKARVGGLGWLRLEGNKVRRGMW